jgi:hypothetical protein
MNKQLALKSHAQLYQTIRPFLTLPSLLTPPWTDIDHFLADLGNDNVLAIIEARRHFHLPPLE